MLRSFIVIAIACISAGTIHVGSMLNWGYFPAHAYVDPVNRYSTFFVTLFISIAMLEVIRAIKSRYTMRRYIPAQAFIDMTLVAAVVATFFIGQIEIERVKTVRLGNQILKFSSLDYPLGNEYGHGAKPLFLFDEDRIIHSVYFKWGETYGFEEMVFPNGQARFLYSGVLAPNSPNLKDINISIDYITLHEGHVYVNEGNYVLEFFPTHGLSHIESMRFLKLISDEIPQIRADFSQYLVDPQAN